MAFWSTIELLHFQYFLLLSKSTYKAVDNYQNEPNSTLTDET